MITPGPLFTDLYELTMAAGYFDQGIHAPATFSLYLRPHPRRGYFVAAGLEEVISFISDFHFSDEDIAYLSSLKRFDGAFLDYLKDLHFSGDVRALPEGTLFFPEEPVLEVTAPIVEAQLLETFLINTVGLASMLATKAARCVHAAKGRTLIDFSLRRTQGCDAGLAMARSSYLAGFEATSNVLAGKRYGIPVAGTMAHSFVMAFEDETDAFRAYARRFPDQTVLLIDTYDTLVGAHKAVQVAREMAAAGHRLNGVRLDSGDLCELSRCVREIFNAAGLHDVRIFASGGYDEYLIAETVDRQAPINAFGVGTKAGVSEDAPYVDMVYKMVRFANRDVRKRSSGKISLAGEKQIFRKLDENGNYCEDVIGTRNERRPDLCELLQTVIQNSQRTVLPEDLKSLRKEFSSNFKKLPGIYKSLDAPLLYPVRISKALQKVQQAVDAAQTVG
jgi:nicotinate phosphoribosyltransferase